MAQLLTVEELAERWSMDRRTILKQLKDGTIPAIRLGKQWRISERVVLGIENGLIVTDVRTGTTAAAHSVLADAARASFGSIDPIDEPAADSVQADPDLEAALWDEIERVRRSMRKMKEGDAPSPGKADAPPSSPTTREEEPEHER